MGAGGLSDRDFSPRRSERIAAPAFESTEHGRRHRAGELLERTRELSMLARLAGEARQGSGGVAIVEGAAGIGKTQLLRELCRRAQADGMEVLGARGGELERELPFGVARQLLEPPLRTAVPAAREALLAGAGRLALAVVGEAAGETDARAEPAMATVLHGLHWLSANLASERALVLAVDDAHWADGASLRFLAYLARRIEELPILMLVAMRPFEAPWSSAALDALAGETRATVLRPAPLSQSAVRQLVTHALDGEAEDAFALACHRAAAGNPFLLGELLGTLAEEGVRPIAAEIPRIHETTPAAVSRSVQQRLRRMPAPAAILARAVALLGDKVRLRDAADLGSLDHDLARAAADELARGEILRPGLPLTFVHPMIRSSVYSGIPPVERGHEHGRAARLLAAHGAEPERVAAHLLMAERRGDTWAVDALREAARTALARGAADAAATYLRCALQEPPSAALRPRVSFELGVALARGDLAAAEVMREALALAREPLLRAEIALALGRTLGLAGRHAEAAEALDGGLREQHDDHTLNVRLEAELAGHCLHSAEKLPLGFERLTRVSIEDTPETPAERLLQVIATFGLISAGYIDADRAAAIALAAAADRELAAEESSSLQFFIAETLVFADRPDDAGGVLDEMIATARSRGSLPGVALASAFRAQVALRRGAVHEALADGRAALEVADWAVLGYCRPYVLSFLIDALVEHGEYDEAERLLAAEGPSESWPALWQCGLLVGSQGRLRFAQGRFEEAASDFLAYGERLAPWRPRNPCSIPWRSEAAVALAALGRSEQARQLAAWELGHARAMGATRPLGIALRASAIAEGGARGIELLGEASAVLERSAARLEHARALTDLGAALRRGGERTAAREPLLAALDLAERCGALALAERAREELLASGARPRRALRTGVQSLTASELRVARMASEGRSNRDIAQALFVSLRTVETHLTHVYRKLRISARDQLAAALAEP